MCCSQPITSCRVLGWNPVKMYRIGARFGKQCLHTLHTDESSSLCFKDTLNFWETSAALETSFSLHLNWCHIQKRSTFSCGGGGGRCRPNKQPRDSVYWTGFALYTSKDSFKKPSVGLFIPECLIPRCVCPQLRLVPVSPLPTRHRTATGAFDFRCLFMQSTYLWSPLLFSVCVGPLWPAGWKNQSLHVLVTVWGKAQWYPVL